MADKKSSPRVKPAVQEPSPMPPPPPIPPTPPTPLPPQPMAPGDEHTWGMLSHLSVLLNLVTGFGGPIAAFVIYLVYKDRSRFVAYHSLQSLIFQLIWWVGGGALVGISWAISGLLSAVCIGVLLMPFALLVSLLPLASLIYGIIGAVQTSQGQDFKYWLIGDWVRGTLTGQ
jgi:uncharacterized Tic20 family protein